MRDGAVGRLIGAAVVVCWIAMPAISQAPVTDTSGPEQDLTTLETQWWDAIKNHDRVALEAVLADDFMGVDNGAEPATTKHGWVDWAMTFQLKSYVLEKLELRISGDTAIVAVHYSTIATVKGAERRDRGVDMDVFVRRRGRWQALGTGEIKTLWKE
jgi:ketosteroid isomerase-like protein